MALFPDTRVSLILRLADPQDVQAWHEFSAIYGPALYGFARRFGLQAADAEDLVQETLFAVARAIERYELDAEKARFRTWLAKIAKNRLIDLCERDKRFPRTGATDPAWFSEVAARCEMSNIDEEFQKDFRSALFQYAGEHIRRRVHDATWQAFHQTAVLRIPPEQVAESLGMSLGNLYVARCRVLKMLREMVSKLDHEYSNEYSIQDTLVAEDLA